MAREDVPAGGIARIGQINLLQPILALGLSALLLGEHVSWPFFVTAIVALTSMAIDGHLHEDPTLGRQ